jgi:hypothetical protein
MTTAWLGEPMVDVLRRSLPRCSTAAGQTSPPLRGSKVGTVDTHPRDVSHFAIIFVERGMTRPEKILMSQEPTGDTSPDKG